MGTKQIRVHEDTYERIKSENREGESLADTVDRMLGEYSLLEFSDNVAAITEETDEEHPSASELEELTEAADEANTEEIEEQLL